MNNEEIYMTPIIKTTGVSKEFRTGKVMVHALREVSLTVDEGEMVAIVGPSGSGKSTLLGLMGGLDTPSAGQVDVDGTDITAMGENQLSDIRSAKIGFVFQSFNLISTLTALENVALPAQFARKHGIKPTQRARELLNRLGLGERLKHRPAELSAGEQQRVAIARALINNPLLLLTDEPTGNLDTRSGAEVVRLLREFNQQGQTIVMITHDPKIASQADRILFLRDGRIVDEMHLGNGNRRTERVLNKLIQLEP
jgi:ABC-type lipoprotein export system ATPase subunit